MLALLPQPLPPARLAARANQAEGYNSGFEPTSLTRSLRVSTRTAFAEWQIWFLLSPSCKPVLPKHMRADEQINEDSSWEHWLLRLHEILTRSESPTAPFHPGGLLNGPATEAARALPPRPDTGQPSQTGSGQAAYVSQQRSACNLLLAAANARYFLTLSTLCGRSAVSPPTPTPPPTPSPRTADVGLNCHVFVM